MLYTYLTELGLGWVGLGPVFFRFCLSLVVLQHTYFTLTIPWFRKHPLYVFTRVPAVGVDLCSLFSANAMKKCTRKIDQRAALARGKQSGGKGSRGVPQQQQQPQQQQTKTERPLERQEDEQEWRLEYLKGLNTGLDTDKVSFFVFVLFLLVSTAVSYTQVQHPPSDER